jgi:hypothetical protein
VGYEIETDGFRQKINIQQDAIVQTKPHMSHDYLKSCMWSFSIPLFLTHPAKSSGFALHIIVIRPTV